jgi:hypothetical protein
MREASYVIGIEIHRDRKIGLLENVLKRYDMHKCKPSPAPIVKDNKFGNFQYP